MYTKKTFSNPTPEEYFTLLKYLENLEGINVFECQDFPNLMAINFFMQLINNGSLDKIYILKLEEEFGLSFTGRKLKDLTILNIKILEKFLIEREKLNNLTKEEIHDFLLYNVSFYCSSLGSSSSDEDRQLRQFVQDRLPKGEGTDTYPIVDIKYLSKKTRNLKFKYFNENTLNDMLDGITELSEDKDIKTLVEKLKTFLNL